MPAPPLPPFGVLVHGAGGGGGGAAAPAAERGRGKRGLGGRSLSPLQKILLRQRMEAGKTSAKKARGDQRALARAARASSAPAMGRPKKEVAVPKAPGMVDHFAEKRQALDELLGETGQGVSVTLERAIAALGAYYIKEDTDGSRPISPALPSRTASRLRLPCPGSALRPCGGSWRTLRAPSPSCWRTACAAPRRRRTCEVLRGGEVQREAHPEDATRPPTGGHVHGREGRCPEPRKGLLFCARREGRVPHRRGHLDHVLYNPKGNVVAKVIEL